MGFTVALLLCFDTEPFPRSFLITYTAKSLTVLAFLWLHQSNGY
jgi:hypothetical protein